MLTEDRRLKYETMKEMAADEIERFDKELAEEVLRAKQRIEELQQSKKAAKQIYDAACTVLGVKSVIEMKEYRIGDMEKQG